MRSVLEVAAGWVLLDVAFLLTIWARAMNREKRTRCERLTRGGRS